MGRVQHKLQVGVGVDVGQSGGVESMRLNYTMSDENAIDKAIETLSQVIKEKFVEHRHVAQTQMYL